MEAKEFARSAVFVEQTQRGDESMERCRPGGEAPTERPMERCRPGGEAPTERSCNAVLLKPVPVQRARAFGSKWRAKAELREHGCT